MSESDLTVLPSYDALRPDPSTIPSPSPPTYSSQPHANEETVAYTPRAIDPLALEHEGTFVRRWPQATLLLKGQDEGARLPTYGRGGKIIGELGLTHAERVVCVTVKLAGKMSLSVADTGSSETALFSETVVLWKQDPACPSPKRCPSLFPLFLSFPATYEAEGKHWRMPPSFEATFLGIPALFVRCLYTLSVSITRIRLGSWTTSKTYITLVNHRPRMRPPRPVVMLDTVFASIKPIPEEWSQIVARMNVLTKFESMKGIDCHLFLPSVTAYALTDPIPFHLQLTSSIVSLRELFPPSSVLLQPPSSKSSPDPHAGTRFGASAIRVTIARQVVVGVGEQKRFRTFTVGMSRMWPVPPQARSRCGSMLDLCGGGGMTSSASLHDAIHSDLTEMDDADSVCLDWQGEVKCWPEVAAGGFTANRLCVKDFLVLALTPANPRTSFLVPLQLSHPIRFVTDAWVDADGLHPQDR